MKFLNNLMRLIASTLGLLACSLVVFAVSAPAFADGLAVAMDPSMAPPEWIAPILMWLKSMPVVGPYVIAALRYVAAVSTAFTALTVCAHVVLGIPELALRWAGAPAAAAKIKALSDKVMPWLKYLSMFNAPKAVPAPEAPKAG